MNPRIPTDYQETGDWLENFVRSHAKRVDARTEVLLDRTGAREGHSYGVRLVLDGRAYPPPESSPIELDFREAAEGRSRFAWCQALGERVRAAARALTGAALAAG
jgi:hypothetical protein